jgi:hypothetical protein
MALAADTLPLSQRHVNLGLLEVVSKPYIRFKGKEQADEIAQHTRGSM